MLGEDTTKAVLAHLQAIHPDVADVFKLVTATGAKRNTVRSAFLRLVSRGQAERARPGWYRARVKAAP